MLVFHPVNPGEDLSVRVGVVAAPTVGLVRRFGVLCWAVCAGSGVLKWQEGVVVWLWRKRRGCSAFTFPNARRVLALDPGSWKINPCEYMSGSYKVRIPRSKRWAVLWVWGLSHSPDPAEGLLGEQEATGMC